MYKLQFSPVAVAVSVHVLSLELDWERYDFQVEHPQNNVFPMYSQTMES